VVAVSFVAAAGGAAGVDTAELHAPFSHQELLLRSALGLADDTRINPSGGPLAGNPMFTGGAIRIGEAARRIWDGSSDRALATATSGPALQQNLVCVMEGRA
jgi:acetyl-CoA acetyltransferase